MTKARNLADNALTTVSPTELGYVDGVTSSIQTQLDAKIAKTLTTTTGDIIYASSANTPARLGIGSTGQALTVSGGVPSWATPAAGSITLLSTTALSGSSVTISSISQDYTNLVVMASGVNSTSSSYSLRWNNSSTLSYVSSPIVPTSGETGELSVPNNSTSPLFTIQMNNYSNTTFMKQGWAIGTNGKSAGANYLGVMGVEYASTTAITSITFITGAGTFSSGSILVYGVK